MKIDSDIENIVDKVMDGDLLIKDEIICLLKRDYQSLAAGMIMAVANEINRTASFRKAEIHAQIGLNLSPCPNNCSFCAFAATNMVFKESNELDAEDVIQLALKAETSGANLFWAEAGSNPRDTEAETSKGRGMDIKSCVEMFKEADFGVLKGPSVIYSGSRIT